MKSPKSPETSGTQDSKEFRGHSNTTVVIATVVSSVLSAAIATGAMSYLVLKLDEARERMTRLIQMVAFYNYDRTEAVIGKLIEKGILTEEEITDKMILNLGESLRQISQPQESEPQIPVSK